MQFSIITPSFRNSNWLKLCIPSVADQGVELEHIVQDACSDDETRDWLPHDQRVRAVIEKDGGMYDAINRGLAKGKGDILAYLNCDEQYLPGALRRVWDYFEKHPEIEMVFSNAIIVETDGRFRCFRKMVLPQTCHTWVCCLCTLTCGTFFRRSLIEKKRHLFDTNYRYIGDADWVLRAIKGGVRMGLLPNYTSAFTETGYNINLSTGGLSEENRFRNLAPFWMGTARPLWLFHHRLRRLFNGTLWEKPFSYAIYTSESPNERITFRVDKPTPRWHRTLSATA